MSSSSRTTPRRSTRSTKGVTADDFSAAESPSTSPKRKQSSPSQTTPSSKTPTQKHARRQRITIEKDSQDDEIENVTTEEAVANGEEQAKPTPKKRGRKSKAELEKIKQEEVTHVPSKKEEELKSPRTKGRSRSKAPPAKDDTTPRRSLRNAVSVSPVKASKLESISPVKRASARRASFVNVGVTMDKGYWLLLGLFLLAIAVEWQLYLNLPKAYGRSFQACPMTYKHWIALVKSAHNYCLEHQTPALTFFVSLLLVFQTFALPGSLILNVLGGVMFGLIPGLATISIATTVGSTLCFLISSVLGVSALKPFLSSSLAYWQKKSLENRSKQLGFIVILRMMPYLPAWYMNVIAPHLGLDFGLFVFGTLIGSFFHNWMYIQVGVSLYSYFVLGNANGLDLPHTNTWISVFLSGMLPLLVRGFGDFNL